MSIPPISISLSQKGKDRYQSCFRPLNRPFCLELQGQQPTGRFPLGNGTSFEVFFFFRASISSSMAFLQDETALQQGGSPWDEMAEIKAL